MPVQFIIGRAGTGKTHRCFTQIVEAMRAEPVGPAIFWILPRQATFSAERELTCASGLGGYVRARVVSFEQLGHEILAECGGATIPELTPIGRQMILGHLLRRNAADLKYFKNVAKHPGLAAKLDATFSELERAGRDASDLDVLLKEIDADGNAALLDKVHDLRLIYGAYTDYLGRDRFDQHQRLLYVMDCLERSKMFKGATVYVDGFRDFSEYERRVLARLGRVCRTVEITLPMDPASPLLREPNLYPHELSLFHPVEMAYRRLRLVLREEAVPVDEPPVVLTTPHRFKKPALAVVERSAFARDRIGNVPGDGIERVEAPDRAAEVDAAARRIRQLMIDGFCLRDVVVIARDLAPYHDLIHGSFAEHGIRYFLDRRRQTAHHPLLQFVRSVLVIAQQAWPHEWLMTLLKTDLTGLASAEADELENYVLRHRIRGPQWATAEPWAFHETGLLHDEEERAVPVPEAGAFSADRARRAIVDALTPFVDRTRGSATVREIVAALFECIARLPVRQTIAGWMDRAKADGDFELMDEHLRVWNELSALFDQMVDLLGDERVGLAGFQEILEAGLEQFDLALTPPTVDEVLVGQVDRTRVPGSVRAVLVLGLAEGVFPKVHREDSVLSDADRRVFHERAMDVSPPSDRRVLDESFMGYVAFTCASELLYLSRPRSDDNNRPLGPSVFWTRITQTFPQSTPTVLPRDARDDPSLIATPRQLVASLMRWVRGSSETKDDPAWPALYQWLTTQGCDDDHLDGCRYGAWRSLGHVNAAALSPDIVRRLFASPLRVGVAQLETFAACPFKHFLSYGLGLEAREADDGVSALDLGNVYHQVLDRVVSDLLKRRQTWADLTDAERQRLIHRLAEQISHGLRGEIFLSSARNRYLLDRIERTLNQVVSTQKASAARGKFRPAHTRVRFGEGGTLPEFTVATPKGAEVRISGKIDRVDLHESTDDAAVVDYRLGDRRLSLDEVYHGLSLQLLTYLLVLEANGEALAGKRLTPAAAFYVRMLRWLGTVEHPSEALSPDDPLFHLAAKPRGLLDERVARDLDVELDCGKSAVIQVHVKNDGSFGYRSTCDGADGEEFAAVLAHVRKRLGELADEVLAGEIGIRPYMLGQATPCPRCEYRSVCRFEPAERYRVLSVLGRDGVMRQIGKPTGESDE